MTTSNTPEHKSASSASDPHAAAPAPHDEHANTSSTGRRALLAGLGGLAAGAMFASRAQAGPLDPPAGPITSTGKTLTDIEPRTAVNATNTPGDAMSVFRITQSGSYYLTDKVSGETGKNGIVIAASNVTLDLNGFAVIGVPGSLRGIANDGPQQHVAIRNGIVSHWGSHGISMAIAISVDNCRIEDIIAAANGSTGIVSGSNSVIARCLSHANGIFGFSGGINVSMSNCVARSNGGTGFSLISNATVTNCSARTNGGTGFSLGSGSTISGCSSIQNTGNGITAATGSTIIGCTSVSNTDIGISSSGAVTISQGTAHGNGSRGIDAASRSAIDHCMSVSNTTNGIQVASDASVIACTCSNNGSGSEGSGIVTTGSDCRIEDNVCTDNGIGIRTLGTGNFIARNRCSGNVTANWNIAAGTVCLVVNAATTNAFVGNSGGTAPGSTDPNANFTF